MIDWSSIISIARYQAQIEGTNRDAAEQTAVIQNIKSNFPEISELFDAVMVRATSIRKPIEFNLGDVNPSYIGMTDSSYRDRIKISINSNLSREKMRCVLVHELGEADYIAQQFPDVQDSKNLLSDTKYIMELFSHRHARNLAEVYHLSDLSESHYNGDKDFAGLFIDPWHITLMLAWVLVTFPSEASRINEYTGYNDYREYVDRIVSIVMEAELEPQAVEQAMAEVISILEGLCMHTVTVSSRRIPTG